MSDYEDDDDGEIDYNPDEDIPQDDEDNGGLNLEDNFLQAENADDQIQAYKDIIDLELSNSNEKKWSFKSYEKLSIIFLKKYRFKTILRLNKKCCFKLFKGWR